MSSEKVRCKWVGKSDLAIQYHDHVWGTRPKDDRGYFEALCLEIFEAGLNFKLILGKLEHFRKQYGNFEPRRTSRLTETDVEKILEDTEGVRSRVKAEAIIYNASAVLKLEKEHGSFAGWVTETAKLGKADAEKEFKKHFKFVGPTIVYEFLSSTGHWPTPHEAECFKFKGKDR